MSVRFVPATIRHELESQNTQLDAQRENFQSVADAIGRYREEGRLLGRAFQAHKDYFGDGHLPFITAFRSMMLSQRNANVYHISRLGGLTHAYYNQAQIESELSQLAWSIPAAQAMVILLFPNNAAWQTILSTRRARRDLLQEKQRQLSTYMTATATIYNDAEAQLQNVRRLLTRIEMQRVCDTTGVVSLPTIGEVIAAKVMNADGTPNWGVIEEILGRDAANITAEEFQAIVVAMGQMEYTDLQRMLQLMTEPVDIPHWQGGDIPIHQFRQDLLLHFELHAFAAMLSAETEAEQNQLAQLFTMFGWMAATPYPFSIHENFLNVWRDDRGGLVVSFNQFGNRAWRPDDLAAHLAAPLWQTREITFSEPIFGGAGALGYRLRELIGEAALYQFNEDVNNVFLNGLFAYGPDIVLGLLGKIPKIGYGVDAFNKLNKLTSLTNAWLNGYTQAQLENLARLAEIDGILRNWNISDFATHFALNGVIISEDGSMQPQVSLFPGSGTPLHGNYVSTEGMFYNFNQTLNNSSINLDEFVENFNATHGANFQLSNPLNVGDIFPNLPLFNALYWALVHGGDIGR